MGASSSSNNKVASTTIDEAPKMNTYSVTSKPDQVCKMETFVISYSVKIECYSQMKLLVSSIDCGTFNLAGHRWTIFYYPDGMSGYVDHAVFYIKLLTETSSTIYQNVRVRLIDPDGKKVAFANWGATYDHKSDIENSVEFITRRSNLDLSGYLKDDCISFEFMIRTVKWSPTEVTETETKSYLSVPCSNLHEHLGQLLVNNGVEADVTIEVCTGSSDNFIEIFKAHKSVLAARSPVFKSQLVGSTTKNESDCISIEDVDASVFRIVLHFIYTDELPLTNFSFEMTQKLFVAASRYKLEKLEQLCEEKLCAGFNSEMDTSTLAWAEKHNCQPLKKAYALNFYDTHA